MFETNGIGTTQAQSLAFSFLLIRTVIHSDLSSITIIYVQKFVKTQFAGAAIAIAVIELFRRVEPFFDSLKIEDEGEFWDTSDESILSAHIGRSAKVLAEMLARDPKSKGPVRLPDGRIVDYMS